MTTTDLRTRTRRLVLRHGEKFLVACAAFALIHSLFATQWHRYPRNPGDFTQAISATEAKLAASSWPESERQRFSLAEEGAVANLVQRGLREPLDVLALASSQTFHHRLGAEERPLLEPVLFPVQELIASSERVLVPLTSSAPAPLGIDDQPASDDDVIPDEFRSQRVRRTSPTRQTPATSVRSQSLAAGAVHTAQRIRPQGHGYSYVAVRGWIDLPRQVRAYVEAIHKSSARAEQEFEIIDFQLERQRLIGNDRWAPWEPANRDVYFDVMRKADGIAQDVISAAATDSAITGPLPARITGRWSKQATHPRLERYELSDEELRRELEYLTVLARRAQQQPQNQPHPLAKRGFTDLVRDSHTLSQSVFDRSDLTPAPGVVRRPQFGGGMQPTQSRLDRLVQEVSRELNPKHVDPQLLQWVRARATAQRRLLLYRYLDFEVVPGETYRYRVRLEIRNPNYRKPLTSASVPQVVQGATRWTPWSEPTEPVAVEALATYYLTGIEPSRRRSGVEARMQVYQYDVDVGTMREQSFPIACGQLIGGTARTTRANPVEGKIEEGLYDFDTANILVDGLPDYILPMAEHPELSLPRDSRGRAFLAESVIVLRPERGLQVIDTDSQAANFADQRQRMQWQSDQLQYLQRASAVSNDDLLGPDGLRDEPFNSDSARRVPRS